jgi:hypothetical protein
MPRKKNLMDGYAVIQALSARHITSNAVDIAGRRVLREGTGVGRLIDRRLRARERISGGIY